MAEGKESDPGLVVRGFIGAYAPGNGDYKFIGEANGFPSYARDSDHAATNWRVFHAEGHWVIGNETNLADLKVAGFAWVTSDDTHPYKARAIWNNSRVNILQKGHGPLFNDITVDGFIGAYAPGNGKYHYIGDHDRVPAYARQSETHATNWRVFQWSKAYWIIGNADALKNNSSAHFAYATSSDGKPPQTGYNNSAVSVGAPSIYVRGFLDAYAPGNGPYKYIGHKNGYPSYKRDSETEATNWRVYWVDGSWVIGNEDGYNSNSKGGFATADSAEVSPQSVTCIWSNNRVNVLENGDPPLVDNISVAGFEGAYAPGNGNYFYCGDHDGKPAYARDSLEHATNWRVYHTGDIWNIGNSDGLKENSSGGFASAKSDGSAPPKDGYSNGKITVADVESLNEIQVFQ